MFILYLSLKNALAKPLTTLLTLSLFSLSVGMTVFLMLFNAQVEQGLNKNLGGIDLVVGAKGSPLQMILSAIFHIDNPTGNIKLQDVAFLMRNRNIQKTIPQALGDSYKGFRICGTSHAYVDVYKGKIKDGFLWKNDFECIIGSNVAVQTGLQVGNPLVSAHGLSSDGDKHEEQPFKVVGILKPTGSVLDNLVLTSVASVWDMHRHAESHETTIPADSLRSTDDMEREITTLLVFYKDKTSLTALNLPRLVNQNTILQAASPLGETARLYQLIGNGTQLIGILGYVVALLSAFSVFIALYSGLRERRYELAMMRLLGGGRRVLFSVILVEGLLLAALGALGGFLVAHSAIALVGKIAANTWHYSFSGLLWLPDEWLVLLAAIAIGFLAALLPAIAAMRVDIAKTLRS